MDSWNIYSAFLGLFGIYKEEAELPHASWREESLINLVFKSLSLTHVDCEKLRSPHTFHFFLSAERWPVPPWRQRVDMSSRTSPSLFHRELGQTWRSYKLTRKYSLFFKKNLLHGRSLPYRDTKWDVSMSTLHICWLLTLLLRVQKGLCGERRMTAWTVAQHIPLSIGFFSQEY